ncbi:MAG TPA: hypothetical protein VGF23_06010 [Gaiellaceae bacterium]|jgi:hypothetical protein
MSEAAVARQGVLQVEVVEEIIRKLVDERQQLRRRQTDAATLEANRLSIVYWQAQLSRSLLARHAPAA